MAARAAKGLSAADLETLRAQVESGRRPKVVFTANAGQIAGQAGQVTALDDPAGSDEWITVRFGKDELPFAPGDLQFAPKPTKGAAKTAAGARRRAAEPAPDLPAPRSAPSTPATAPTAAAPAGGSASVPAARSGGERGASVSASRSTAAPGAGAAPRSAATSGSESASRSASPAGSVGATAGGPVAKVARKAARGKGPAELAVTLSWRDGDWSVQAQRGSRVVARPAPVKASDALRMVGMLDAPEVAEVVAEIVEAERSAAQEQAERLRQELAAVEAKLAELP